MKRLISICSGQFGDLSLDSLCAMMNRIGYDALELACQAHIDVEAIAKSDTARNEFLDTLNRHNLKIGSISAHLIGQCVGDRYDPRLDNFAPSKYAGNPEAIRSWAIDKMMCVANAAKKVDVDVVSCFLGSPIWAFWYSFPQTTPQMVADGFGQIKELWTPIFDEFDRCGIRLALEVHPTEIAFDYYSTQRLFETIDYRPTLGLNYDPSHLLWQGVDPCVFLHDFADRVYHVHMKDVKISKDPRTGVLGSHIEFGDTRRKWNFVSLGHGDIDFDGIIRELNQAEYRGPLCVEWEDSGMEREFGAAEALEYVRRINFEPSSFGFDAALKAK